MLQKLQQSLSPEVPQTAVVSAHVAADEDDDVAANFAALPLPADIFAEREEEDKDDADDAAAVAAAVTDEKGVPFALLPPPPRTAEAEEEEEEEDDERLLQSLAVVLAVQGGTGRRGAGAAPAGYCQGCLTALMRVK